MPIVKKLNFGHATAMRYTFHCHCMYSVRLGWCIEVHQMYFSLARKRYTTCLNVLYCRNVAKQKCWRTIYHLRFALLMVPAYEMILKSSGKVVAGYRHTCNNSQGGRLPFLELKGLSQKAAKACRSRACVQHIAYCGASRLDLERRQKCSFSGSS